MAMAMGGSRGNMADINVTPMIDILLVLLIIFMLIVPVTPKGIEAQAPQSPKAKTAPPESTIVVQILARPGQLPGYRINDAAVTHEGLLPELTRIYANRAERAMFVKADDAVGFASVADVIDIAKAANVDRIGLMTPKIQAGL